MGGRHYRLVYRSVERYDCKSNQWSFISPMNTQRASAAAAVLNDKIYVAGGIDDTDFLNTVEVYDPDTDRWTFVAPMLSERRWFACVPFHGYLYALGTK
ncbi:Kelch-like protein diablo [Zootermopsis nevadensis]|uniref:Kelch-like protein diablo n=1 Tax=Zootermopsis nevadensis TaxID=136037 RepID=A0A067QJQ5_ZOONE|nr:Kelch-like protein diablo [Zootermopsis nevadensis]